MPSLSPVDAACKGPVQQSKRLERHPWGIKGVRDVHALIREGVHAHLYSHEVELAPPSRALAGQPPTAAAEVDGALAAGEGGPTKSCRPGHVPEEREAEPQEALKERKCDGLCRLHGVVANLQDKEANASCLEARQRVARNLRREGLEEVDVSIKGERTLHLKLSLEVSAHFQKHGPERLLPALEPVQVHHALNARDIKVY